MNGIEFKNDKFLSQAWAKERNNYNNSPDNPVIYKEGFLVKGKAYNYLNSSTSKVSDRILKPLITSIFDQLEKIYPTSGEIFLNYAMNVVGTLNSAEKLLSIEDECDKVISFLKQNTRNIHKSDYERFLNEEISEENKPLINTIVENITIDTKIYVEKGYGTQTIIKKINEFTFDVDFDCDFLLKKDKWEAKDYNFVIIDGFIDSVGEIYHLLTKASENMEPYVIFCKGMKPEVKSVIIQNLMRGTINVFPVSLAINELNLNILADIAMCHKSDVISSLQGETISIATRRKLPRGKKISIGPGYFTLLPVADKKRIDSHKNYLMKRKSEAKIDANTELIDKRLKILFDDKLILKLGSSHIKEDSDFLRDFAKINYFLKSGSTGISSVESLALFEGFCKTIPTMAAINLIKSIKSFCKTVYNTRGAVIIN